MADRYQDYDRDDRPGEAWRERDDRWRAREHDRPFTDRATDEVRSWFGDDEARRRREMDERREGGRWRERGERDWDRTRREEATVRDSWREGDRGGSWGRPEYGTTYERDRGERRGGADLNRERDFGRTDRYANTDEGMGYGRRDWNVYRPSGYGRRTEAYRGTSGYERGRGAGSFGSWGPLDERSRASAWSDWEAGPFAGRGPRGYRRSDEHIREEVCERLTRHGRVDATDIEIRVANGEVTLEGSVNDRESKRLAEDVAESVFGVRDVTNHIKVRREEMEPVGTAGYRNMGDTRGTGEHTSSVLGLAGTANTPEITPPDREEPQKR
jgi:osmotically-inducible protein OsmY